MFPPCQARGTQRNLAEHSTSRGSKSMARLTTIPHMLSVAIANRSPDNFVLAKCGMQFMPGLSPGVGQCSHALLHSRAVLNDEMLKDRLAAAVLLNLPISGKAAHT